MFGLWFVLLAKNALMLEKGSTDSKHKVVMYFSPTCEMCFKHLKSDWGSMQKAIDAKNIMLFFHPLLLAEHKCEQIFVLAILYTAYQDDKDVDAFVKRLMGFMGKRSEWVGDTDKIKKVARSLGISGDQIKRAENDKKLKSAIEALDQKPVRATEKSIDSSQIENLPSFDIDGVELKTNPKSFKDWLKKP